MLGFFNRFIIKHAIENNKRYAPKEWRKLCVSKIRSGYGGTYPQFNTVEQLEKALIRTNWYEEKNMILPDNMKVYTSNLQGQLEYVNLNNLNFDTLLYANVDEESDELSLTVKGVNPGKSTCSYLVLDHRGGKTFINSFSTGELQLPSTTNKHNFRSGDILTKRQANSLHLDIVSVNKICLTFTNKVAEAIKQSKKYYPSIWQAGCADLIMNCYTQFKSVEEFEDVLFGMNWTLMKRGSGNNTLRYMSREIQGSSETCRIENIKDSTELIFRRESKNDESSPGYIQAIGESMKVSRVTIMDIVPSDDKLLVDGIYCGMPVTTLSKGTAKYRDGERISKNEAIDLGFQYVLIR